MRYSTVKIIVYRIFNILYMQLEYIYLAYFLRTTGFAVYMHLLKLRAMLHLSSPAKNHNDLVKH